MFSRLGTRVRRCASRLFRSAILYRKERFLDSPRVPVSQLNLTLSSFRRSRELGPHYHLSFLNSASSSLSLPFTLLHSHSTLTQHIINTMSRLANTETNSFEEEKGTTQHNELARPTTANDYANDPALQVTPEFSKKTMYVAVPSRILVVVIVVVPHFSTSLTLSTITVVRSTFVCSLSSQQSTLSPSSTEPTSLSLVSLVWLETSNSPSESDTLLLPSSSSLPTYVIRFSHSYGLFRTRTDLVKIRTDCLRITFQLAHSQGRTSCSPFRYHHPLGSGHVGNGFRH